MFASVDASERHGELAAQADASGIEWHVVSDDVVAEVADSVTPQGVVARCRSIVRPLAELPADVGFVVVCADIRDPGNAGAVIRCADAVGADAVILAGDSVDPLNPKAVRASAGSLFHLPIVVHRDVAETLDELRSRGLQILAADASGDHHIFDTAVDPVSPTAWVFGNEAWGLPGEITLPGRHRGRRAHLRTRREPESRHGGGRLPVRHCMGTSRHLSGAVVTSY